MHFDIVCGIINTSSCERSIKDDKMGINTRISQPRIEVFNDTREMYNSHFKLVKVVENSISAQRFYGADETISIGVSDKYQLAKVVVTSKFSFEAAAPYYLYTYIKS